MFQVACLAAQRCNFWCIVNVIQFPRQLHSKVAHNVVLSVTPGDAILPANQPGGRSEDFKFNYYTTQRINIIKIPFYNFKVLDETLKSFLLLVCERSQKDGHPCILPWNEVAPIILWPKSTFEGSGGCLLTAFRGGTIEMLNCWKQNIEKDKTVERFGQLFKLFYNCHKSVINRSLIQAVVKLFLTKF